MEEINWEPTIDKVETYELTEEDKKIAKECSDIEMEFKEAISLINSNNEQNES